MKTDGDDEVVECGHCERSYYREIRVITEFNTARVAHLPCSECRRTVEQGHSELCSESGWRPLPDLSTVEVESDRCPECGRPDGEGHKLDCSQRFCRWCGEEHEGGPESCQEASDENAEGAADVVHGPLDEEAPDQDGMDDQ
jgi:hypothetical protein